MQTADAGRAIDRLRELVNKGPGANPEALKEVSAMLFSLHDASQATGYVAEKLNAAQGSFDAWLSDHTWQAQGSEPQVFRTILLGDIEKLRKALARGAAGQD